MILDGIHITENDAPESIARDQLRDNVKGSVTRDGTYVRTRRAADAEEWRRSFLSLGAVYIIRDDDAARVKIGYSRNPLRRRSTLQVGCSGRLRIIAIIAAPQEIETTIHRQYDELRLHGEWFDDSQETISREIARMNRGEPICTGIWEIEPCSWRISDHPTRPGWKSLDYGPAE